jgi:hypothetical protein
MIIDVGLRRRRTRTRTRLRLRMRDQRLLKKKGEDGGKDQVLDVGL